jgi:hypothetical protein
MYKHNIPAGTEISLNTCFLNWFNTFRNAGLKVVLDEPSSRASIKCTNYCKESDSKILCLPPHILNVFYDLSTELCPSHSRQTVTKKQSNSCTTVLTMQSRNSFSNNISLSCLDKTLRICERCQRFWVHRYTLLNLLLSPETNFFPLRTIQLTYCHQLLLIRSHLKARYHQDHQFSRRLQTQTKQDHPLPPRKNWDKKNNVLSTTIPKPETKMFKKKYLKRQDSRLRTPLLTFRRRNFLLNFSTPCI